MATGKIKIGYLQEAGFREQMEQVVEPYLKKYRRTGKFISYDGTGIFYCTYLREHAAGSIVISHGFGEFAEKYNEVIYYFLQAGYSVYMHEHRGHGRSGGRLHNKEKVYAENFAQYVRDLHIFVKKIVRQDREGLYLFAHSMGGAVGAIYLQRYPDDFKKAILSAPMIQMRVSGLPYGAAMMIARVCTRCGFGKAYAAGQKGFSKKPCLERSSCLSEERHLYVHGKRLAHKSYRMGGASYAWVYAAQKASAYVQDTENIARIKVPVLVLVAGKDHMVDTDEICRFAGKLRHARLVWFLDARHEIFHAKERTRLQFYDEIFSFLQE